LEESLEIEINQSPLKMTNPESSDSLPPWAMDLISLGECFLNLTRVHEDRRLTLALCLPRVEFAAAFLGLGILKMMTNEQMLPSQEEHRIRGLLGEWVTFQGTKRKPVIGQLEYFENEKKYKIREPVKQNDKKKIGASSGLLHVLRTQDFDKVQRAGRSYNQNRRVGSNQFRKVISQNNSLSVLGKMLTCELEHLQSQPPGDVFNIYGNRSRIDSDMLQSLMLGQNVCLADALRPSSLRDYEESHRCQVFPARSVLPEDGACIVIIEGSRGLPDQLSATSNSNRIILLARNSPCYEECVDSVLDRYRLRKGDLSEPIMVNSKLIISRAFFHK